MAMPHAAVAVVHMDVHDEVQLVVAGDRIYAWVGEALGEAVFQEKLLQRSIPRCGCLFQPI